MVPQVTYQCGDEIVSYQKGQSTSLLSGWKRLRDGEPGEEPDTRWMQYRVWGQPAAWCDQVICTWISEYIQELYPQGCIQIVDCLGSQWSPAVVLKCWAANQVQIPIAPQRHQLPPGRRHTCPLPTEIPHPGPENETPGRVRFDRSR